MDMININADPDEEHEMDELKMLNSRSSANDDVIDII